MANSIYEAYLYQYGILLLVFIILEWIPVFVLIKTITMIPWRSVSQRELSISVFKLILKLPVMDNDIWIF